MSFNPIAKKHFYGSDDICDLSSESIELDSIGLSIVVRSYDKARMARFEHGEKP